MHAFIHRVFQLYAIFNQSDIGPLIGRVEVVAARSVICLCVFLFFFHFPLWTYKGLLSCVWGLVLAVSVSSLSFSLSPTIKARSSGAVWTREHWRGGTAELSYPTPPLPSTINHYALIFCGHQTSLKNNAKDFERGDLRNIVRWWSCDYLDQSEFCACTTRRRSFL